MGETPPVRTEGFASLADAGLSKQGPCQDFRAGTGEKGVLRLAVVSLARLERVLEGAGRLQWEAGCWGAPVPQGCSGSLGGGLSPHPPPGVALGGTVLLALAHRRSGKCTGTSGGLSVGAASSPTRPSSEL